jgi:uncharacterized protein (DUF302 family)
MKLKVISACSAVILATSALAADGVVNISSRFTVAETADRMEALLKDKGLTVFSRVDHSGAAAKAGVVLRDTQLLIFGNPKVGSPLMKCEQSIAIDLPQKALVWKDENADVWISYNDPSYLASRHQLAGCEEVIAKIKKVLLGISQAAGSE